MSRLNKFRKKPVVVEAFQMTADNRKATEWPGWLLDAWNKNEDQPGSLHVAGPNWLERGHGQFAINTLEGEHLVSEDDWIIRGVMGEIYPCKPDIFEQTYEPVED